MNILFFSQIESRRRLVKCLAISLIVHTTCLTFFYYNPLILQSSLQSLFGLSTAHPTFIESEEDLNLTEKNALLKEVFEQVLVLSPHFQQPYDFIKLPIATALNPAQEKASLLDPLEERDTELPFGQQEFLATSLEIDCDHQEKILPTLFTPPENGVHIASQLQIDLEQSLLKIPDTFVPLSSDELDKDLMALNIHSFNPLIEAGDAINLSSQHLLDCHLKNGEDLQLKSDPKSITAPITTKDLHLEKELFRSTLFIPKASTMLSQKKEVAVESDLLDFDQYNFPSMATVSQWNDDFDVDVVFLPNPDGNGYIFSLSFNPNYDISNYSLKQNLYFILDCSNSIQKHRFAVFKRAVIKALASMNQGDTFNVFVMDKNMTSFSPTSCAVSMKNIQAAEEFLNKQETSGLFSNVDIYSSIGKILPNIAENEEMHAAILLTDGKSSLSAKLKQSALKKWIEKNNGKVSLYTAAVGRDNDLVSLDLLSSVSGGKLLYSDTHASFPRKLAKLVIDLKDPVAKDLIVTATPLNPHSHIEFYPTNTHLPSLYSHKPYVIVGQIDHPGSFDVVIQGRHRDQWIAIKKNISFIEGKKGDHHLQKQWNAEQANLCYSKFLKEGRGTDLKKAKEILKKSRTEIAYE